MKGKGDLSKRVREMSENILSSTVDMTLFSIFYGFEFGWAGYGKGYKAEKKAIDDVSEFNYQTIKRSIKHLKHRGFVNIIGQGLNEITILPQITKDGLNRLHSIVPQYRKIRIWDNKIYLITYDLPVNKNSTRDKLRSFMKNIGCGLLQKSVWVTPYNPKELIKKFVFDNHIDDELIIVSTLDKGGMVGSWTILELMNNVYNLEELNNRYKEYVEKYSINSISREKAVFSYLSILHDDPQIPFKLLPEGWLGERANIIFKDICNKKYLISKQYDK